MIMNLFSSLVATPAAKLGRKTSGLIS